MNLSLWMLLALVLVLVGVNITSLVRQMKARPDSKERKPLPEGYGYWDKKNNKIIVYKTKEQIEAEKASSQNDTSIQPVEEVE